MYPIGSINKNRNMPHESNFSNPFSNSFNRNVFKQLYNTIINLDHYQQISKHTQHLEKIKKFIQYPNQKALFIYGPTGCGKTMMILHFLKKFKIDFQQCQQAQKFTQNYDEDMRDDQNIENLYYYKITLRQAILKQLDKNLVTRVGIFKNFPTLSPQISKEQNKKNSEFKDKFFKLLPNSHCKLIFVLNSDVYSSYSITKTFGISQTTTIIQLKPYTFTDLKKILKWFLSKYPEFNSLVNKEQQQRILKESTGDMRKVLLDFYLSSTKNQIKKYSSTKKVTLFHGIGKYLYAKRYDQKTRKDRHFTKQQLMLEDPPFYFNPIQLLQKMGISIKIFEDLLFENYLNRYGSVDDIKNTCELFVHLNTKFPFYTKNKHLKEGQQKIQWLYGILLTWGIILNNKNASKVKKNYSQFRRPLNSKIQKQIQNKRQLIKSYYSNTMKNIESLTKINYIYKGTYMKDNIIICLLLPPVHSSKINEIGQNTKMISQEQESKVNEQSLSRIIDTFKIQNVMKKHLYVYQCQIMVENQLNNQDQQIQSDID